MKKAFISFAVFLTVVFCAHAQSDSAAYYVDKCISLLEKPVSEEFQRMDRITYRNDEDIILIVENGIAIVSIYGAPFPMSNEAVEFSALFYNYFEDNGWDFFRSNYDDGSDIYLKAGVYAYINKPLKRDDGLIVAIIGFSKNIDNFL